MTRFRFYQLFFISLLSSPFAFANKVPTSVQVPLATYTCTVNLGYGVKLHVPSNLTIDCDHGRKEIVSDNIS
jgi:hypothetical protein